MGKLLSIRSCLLRLLFLIFLVHVVSHVAVDSQTVVEFLPGYEGHLPFYLETGYVGIGESEEVQFFYYFIKSERNAEKDPLMLWLTGGPGCSSLSALLYEIGPLKFYNASLPIFGDNPYSWTKVSSIIFLDAPVGTGFSYSKIPSAAYSSDTLQIKQIYQFLRKWLVSHPEFSTNAFYIGGDSYSGKIAPGVAQVISNGNERGKTTINLQGYLLGNPVTEPSSQSNYRIPYAHGMALISNELFESLKRSCQEEYVNIDPNNVDCLNDMQQYKQCTEGLFIENILEPDCGPDVSASKEKSGARRSLFDVFLNSKLPLPTPRCRYDTYLLSTYWANEAAVRKALNIRKDTIGSWKRCFGRDSPYYSMNIDSSYSYHSNLSMKGYRSLIYSGDHDLLVPFIATEAWIKRLNYSIVDDWRPWVVEEQIAGYTRTYSNKMTFATVKGAGHTAIEYKQKECFAMFSRWIYDGAL